MKTFYFALLVLVIFAMFGCIRNNDQIKIEQVVVASNNSSLEALNDTQNDSTTNTPLYQVNVGLPIPPNVSGNTTINTNETTNNKTNNLTNTTTYPNLPSPPCVDSDGANISSSGSVTFREKHFMIYARVRKM